MTDELTEAEIEVQQEEDPEAYVERVQEAREAEDARALAEENAARERSGRPSVEEEAEAEEKAAKAAAAEAKKSEKAEEK